MSRFFRRFYGVESTEVNRYCRQEASLLVNRHIKDVFSDINNDLESGLHYAPSSRGPNAGVLPDTGHIREAPTPMQPVTQLNAPIPLHCKRKSCPGHPQAKSQVAPAQDTSINVSRRARREKATTSSTSSNGPISVQEVEEKYPGSGEEVLNTQHRPPHKARPGPETKELRVSEMGYPPNSETHARGRVPYSVPGRQESPQVPAEHSAPNRWDHEPLTFGGGESNKDRFMHPVTPHDLASLEPCHSSDTTGASNPYPANPEPLAHVTNRSLSSEKRRASMSHVQPLLRISHQLNAQQDFPVWSEPKINKRLRRNKSLPRLPPSSILFGTPHYRAQALVSRERQRSDSSIPSSTVGESKIDTLEGPVRPRLRKPASQSTLRTTSDRDEKNDDNLERSHRQVTAMIEICRSKIYRKVGVGAELADSLKLLKELIQMRLQDCRLIEFAELNKLNERLNKLFCRLLKSRKSNGDIERLYEEILSKVDLWVDNLGDSEISKIFPQRLRTSIRGTLLLGNIPLPATEYESTPTVVGCDKLPEYGLFVDRSSPPQNGEELQFYFKQGGCLHQVPLVPQSVVLLNLSRDVRCGQYD